MPGSETATNALRTLRYVASTGEGRLLPDWAQWFVSLGAQIGGASPVPHIRTVVSVSVPSRAYAATLLGLGLIVRRAAIKPAVLDGTGYFDFLCSQPKGTPVILYRENHVRGRIHLQRLDGVIEGCGTDKWGPKLDIVSATVTNDTVIHAGRIAAAMSW